MLTFERDLTKREEQGNLRVLPHPTAKIDFASNDYLGLSRSLDFREKMMERWNLWNPQNIGSTGSRLLTGNSPLIETVEQKISAFHGGESALIFGCGYLANVGLLSAIPRKEDQIFFDLHVHASMRIGIRLSSAEAFPFDCFDLQRLKKRLEQKRNGACYVCISAIDSCRGLIAPLQEIHALIQRYDAHLIIDEAHSVGVIGPSGKGLSAQYGIQPFALVSTFGKAFGAYGAAVIGSTKLKQGLTNFSSSTIYTTAPPAPLLAMIDVAFEAIPQMERERLALLKNVEIFQDLFPNASPSHIQFLPVHGNLETKKKAEFLQEFSTSPLLSPTVRRGSEGIRICLHAFNQKHELLALHQRWNHA